MWRDFYENRFSRIGRPLGEYATNLFMKILKNKDKIYFSEALILELKKAYPKEDTSDMLNLLFLNKILIRIEIKKEEHLETKKLSLERNISYVDCLNVTHARNYDILLVSQDPYCFEDLKDIAKVVKPEQIN